MSIFTFPTDSHLWLCRLPLPSTRRLVTSHPVLQFVPLLSLNSCSAVTCFHLFSWSLESSTAVWKIKCTKPEKVKGLSVTTSSFRCRMSKVQRFFAVFAEVAPLVLYVRALSLPYRLFISLTSLLHHRDRDQKIHHHF